MDPSGFHSTYFNQRNSATQGANTLNLPIVANHRNDNILEEKETNQSTPILAAMHLESQQDEEGVVAKAVVDLNATADVNERKKQIEIEKSRFFFGTEKPPYQKDLNGENLDTVVAELHSFVTATKIGEHRPSNDATIRAGESFDLEERKCSVGGCSSQGADSVTAEGETTTNNNNNNNNSIEHSYSFSNQSSTYLTPQPNTPVNEVYSVCSLGDNSYRFYFKAFFF